MVTYYKIYSKTRDKYIAGTPGYHSWTVAGRLFPSIGKLRAFITSAIKVNQYGGSYNFGDWEVREYTLELKESKELSQIVTPKKLMELLKT